MIRAAGVLIISPQGRVLLIQRSAVGDWAGAWAFPGGKIEDGESPQTAAVRETLEEIGYRTGGLGEPLATRLDGDVHFTTFLHKCDEEFVPKLNDEHTAWAWMLPADALADSPAPPPMTSPGIAA